MKKKFTVVKSTAIITIILLYASIIFNMVLFFKNYDLQRDNKVISNKLITYDKDNVDKINELTDKATKLEKQNTELKSENENLDNMLTKYQKRYGKIYR